MLYINLAENKDDAIPEKYRKLPKILQFLIYKIRKRCGIFYIQKWEDKVMITLPAIQAKVLQRLEKFIKVNCIKTVCLSKNLQENDRFLEFLIGQDVQVLKGNWLLQYLFVPIIEYIVHSKKEELAQQEIAILSKDIDEILVDNIRELASQIKLLNIVTLYEKKFKKIESDLSNQGIILNINNNYKKSLLKSNIIINLDFSEEELNQYQFPKKACIININKKGKIAAKSFEGVFITQYGISLPRKYIHDMIYFKNFDSTILYESFIYKRTTCQNIKKEIQEDGVHIAALYGKSGKIRKSELINLSKNKNNFTN